MNSFINFEEKLVLNDMIEKFGEKQMIVAIEELSELQKEICKKLRNPLDGDNKNLIEEIADCYIMLLQIKSFYHIEMNSIIKVMKEKIERTKRLYLLDKEKDKEQLKNE